MGLFDGVFSRPKDTPAKAWPRTGDTRRRNGKTQTWLDSRWLDDEGLSGEQRRKIRKGRRGWLYWE